MYSCNFDGKDTVASARLPVRKRTENLSGSLASLKDPLRFLQHKLCQIMILRSRQFAYLARANPDLLQTTDIFAVPVWIIL